MDLQFENVAVLQQKMFCRPSVCVCVCEMPKKEPRMEEVDTNFQVSLENIALLPQKVFCVPSVGV